MEGLLSTGPTPSSLYLIVCLWFVLCASLSGSSYPPLDSESLLTKRLLEKQKKMHKTSPSRVVVCIVPKRCPMHEKVSQIAANLCNSFIKSRI